MKSKINDFKEFTDDEIINKLSKNKFELIPISNISIEKNQKC